MPDPYRITETSPTAQAMPSTRDQGVILRSLLWLVLALSAAANVVTSSLNVSVFISIGFGLLTIATGAALIVDHRRRRR